MDNAERTELAGHRGSHWRRHDRAVRVLTGHLAAEATTEPAAPTERNRP